MPGLGGTKTGTTVRGPIRIRRPKKVAGSATGSYQDFDVFNAIQITLTSAQLKALNTTPVLVLAAPALPGDTILVDSYVLNYIYGTVAYTSGGAIVLGYDTTATTPASATIAATFLTSPAANQVASALGSLASALSSAVIDKGLYITAATGNFATGDGTVIVTVYYRVLSIS